MEYWGEKSCLCEKTYYVIYQHKHKFFITVIYVC